MKKKLVFLVVVTFMVSILAIGCQNTAQRPLEPNRNNNVTPNQPNTTMPNNTTGSLTDSEARAMANRLANIAEQVEGVDEASVLISDMGSVGLRDNTGNNTMDQGLGTGTGDDPANPGLRNNTGNNNNMGNTGLRDNAGNNNMGNTGTNMNQNTGRTNGGGLAGITNSINNVNNRVNNNTNMNNTRGLVVMVGLDLNDNYKNNATNMDRIQREVANRIKASDNRISQVYVTTDENMVERIEDVAEDVVNGGTMNTLRNDINNIYRDLVGQGPAF